MYCTKCGKEIKEDARFCIYCGEVVSDSAKKMIQPDVVKSLQPVTPPKQKEQREKWKIAVFALVGIVLVGGMAVIGVLLHKKVMTWNLLWWKM
ncbi:MAG: zinc-ribbon domain-containing protein [Clostridiales bacterium]|nr:zinc-ribbon domain-containing protein [Clostridiales bacterium]